MYSAKISVHLSYAKHAWKPAVSLFKIQGSFDNNEEVSRIFQLLKSFCWKI